MKQSTKLLSMVLALVIAFSCLSVIGSAALDKTAIKYDSIDDAALTYEQVSTLALDLVDNDLLADMDTIDLSIIGELRLNKIDYILADIHSLRTGLIWGIDQNYFHIQDWSFINLNIKYFGVKISFLFAILVFSFFCTIMYVKYFIFTICRLYVF